MSSANPFVRSYSDAVPAWSIGNISGSSMQLPMVTNPYSYPLKPPAHSNEWDRLTYHAAVKLQATDLCKDTEFKQITDEIWRNAGIAKNWLPLEMQKLAKEPVIRFTGDDRVQRIGAKQLMESSPPLKGQRHASLTPANLARTSEPILLVKSFASSSRSNTQMRKPRHFRFNGKGSKAS